MKKNKVKYEKVSEYLTPSIVLKLDSGVIICPVGDFAFGTDGKIYHYIAEKDCDGDLVSLGWSSEIEDNVVLNNYDTK